MAKMENTSGDMAPEYLLVDTSIDVAQNQGVHSKSNEEILTELGRKGFVHVRFRWVGKGSHEELVEYKPSFHEFKEGLAGHFNSKDYYVKYLYLPSSQITIRENIWEHIGILKNLDAELRPRTTATQGGCQIS